MYGEPKHATRKPASLDEGASNGSEAPPAPDAAASRVASAMPWVLSVLFHLSIALVMTLVAIIVAGDVPPVAVAGAAAPRTSPPTEKKTPKEDPATTITVTKAPPVPDPGFENPGDKPGLQKSDDSDTGILGFGDGGGGGDVIGPPRGGGDPNWDRTPDVTTKIWGVPVPDDDIVFLIDRSGSMMAEGAFDLVRMELARCIGELVFEEPVWVAPKEMQKMTHRFHVMFFGPGDPLENPPRALVEASDEHKEALAAFLDSSEITPQGETVVLPALKRAFAVLRSAPAMRDGRARSRHIYLLSDGGFENPANAYHGLTGTKAVLGWLKDNNSPGANRIRITTFLYRADDPQAAKAMQQVADWSGGRFVRVD